MIGKNHQKKSPKRLKTVLDKNDAFDQLILDLATKGELDVCGVELQHESPVSETHEYTRKHLPHFGKHAS